ncbi:hypothetical protein SAMN06264364_102201 [Quadrisphaera granulorum]|uniref:Integral membrane protein n=1 Tax=Quadrisphaera granulorum TaxID=317664 RepID=A0A316ADJ9_9ACTN|nr:hypothetical protein [Quadrisphaera granulorum]PWJ55835.1 hypothetical protein BXY45_102201 [Quadrisphaera granulorum]SZE95332.1 hypothetical protein SAMN06264364_102201 [Quadrisphaera granulorum]
MTTHPATGSAPAGAAPRRHRPLGALNHVGLVLATLLALSDLSGIFLVEPPTETSAQNGPPAEVLWFAFAMAVVTLAGVALAWAGRWRGPAVRIAAVARILSALTAVPAFFVGGVPTQLLVWAAVTVLVTVVAVVLMLLRPRRRA